MTDRIRRPRNLPRATRPSRREIIARASSSSSARVSRVSNASPRASNVERIERIERDASTPNRPQTRHLARAARSTRSRRRARCDPRARPSNARLRRVSVPRVSRARYRNARNARKRRITRPRASTPPHAASSDDDAETRRGRCFFQRIADDGDADEETAEVRVRPGGGDGIFRGWVPARARRRRRARASSARGRTMETRGRTMENGVGARGGIARTRDG